MVDLRLLTAIAMMGAAGLISAALIWRVLHPRDPLNGLDPVDMNDARRVRDQELEESKWTNP